ncbi:MAG: rhamnan synthesis F family protein [Bauldia sp.]
MSALPERRVAIARSARAGSGLASKLLASADAGIVRLLGEEPQNRDLELILWSGLFDAAWYRAANAGLLGGEAPLAHYLRVGGRNGHDPNRWFGAADYVRSIGADALGDRTPLAHFIDAMLEAGLDPRRRADVAEHLRRRADAAAGDARPPVSIPRARPIVRPAPAEDHDLRSMAASDLFDAAWYAATYPEHAATGLDAIEHFAAIGAYEGKDPGPDFSTRGYLEDNPDVARAGANPFLHFLHHGRAEGRPAGRLRRRLTDLFPGTLRLGGAEYGPIARLARFDRTATALPDAGGIAIHVHLFYVDDAEAILAALRNVPGPFTLLLSIPTGEAEEIWQEFFAERLGGRATVSARRLDNRGRDVMPWLVGFRDEIVSADLFCHIHTKRSGHLRQHRDWGRFLLHSTLGSSGVVADIVEMFAADPKLGLVFPPYFASLAAQPSWGRNRDGATELLRRMGLADDPSRCPDYPAGSFFWARPAALRPVFDLNLGAADFDVELGQHDGTLAHAIERLVGAVPPLLGYAVACVGVDVAYNMTRTAWANRPVAAFSAPAARPSPSGFRVAVCTHRSETSSPAGIRQGGVDHFCFVPAGTSAPSGYRPVPLRPAPESRPDAPLAFARTHLSTYFPGYDFVVWHEPEVAILTDLDPILAGLRDTNADIGVVLDPLADDLIGAADRIVARLPDSRAGVLRRLDRYRAEGAASVRPIDPSFLVLRPGAPAMHALLATWWQEAGLLPAGADALGLPYALARSGATATPLFRDGFSPHDDAGFAVVIPAPTGQSTPAGSTA